MPVGSFTLSPNAIPTAYRAFAAGVYLYDASQIGIGQPFGLLPNVRCVSIDNREGPDPPSARFLYVLGDYYYQNFAWPSQFDFIWPIGAQGAYVVQPDTRLVVMGANPDGSPLILFDGFAQSPQADISGESQAVTFSAVGVAIRNFDRPIGGRVQRDGNPDGRVDVTGDSDVQTALPTRFNPANERVGSLGGFLGNCSPETYDTVTDSGLMYPVFMDPASVAGTPGFSLPPVFAHSQPSSWDVGRSIRYLVMRYNADEDYTTNPNTLTIDSDMQDYYPAQANQVMSPDDPDSFMVQPVTIRDYDATNKSWPVAVAALMAYCGFYMRWDTETTPGGTPETFLRFYRRDEFSQSPLKSVYLSDPGVTVGQQTNNAASIGLVRDTSSIVNGFRVETSNVQVEASFVLAPLYQPYSFDSFLPERFQYIESKWTPSTSSATRRKYRWYGVDEMGEGHAISRAPWTESSVPADFSQLFPTDSDGNPTFVQRRRPGHNTLISRDDNGKPLRATLQIVLYSPSTGNSPVTLDPGPIGQQTLAIQFPDSVFDVPHGWRLLSDRLGIEVTEDNPEFWATGAEGPGSLAYIRGISWFAGSNNLDKRTMGSNPIFILTTVVDGDAQLMAEASPRIVSPTVFGRFRHIDGKDHFKYAAVDTSSRYYVQDGGNGANPYVFRDDTTLAQAHADQMRSVHEFPKTAGTITIPWITTRYEVGDQIDMIQGRNVSLQTNIGVDQGESPVYPWVVGVSWTFEGAQSTVLQLSDRRTEPKNSNAW